MGDGSGGLWCCGGGLHRNARHGHTGGESCYTGGLRGQGVAVWVVVYEPVGWLGRLGVDYYRP